MQGIEIQTEEIIKQWTQKDKKGQVYVPKLAAMEGDGELGNKELRVERNESEPLELLFNISLYQMLYWAPCIFIFFNTHNDHMK